MPILDKKNRINCGEFIHPITIQRLSSTGIPNELGIVTKEWVTLHDTRAKIVNNTNKEKYIKDITEYSVVSKKFYFRTPKTIKFKSNDQILYNGDKYNIVSVYDYDDKKIITLIIADLIEG